MTKKEIMEIKDAGERQKAIAEITNFLDFERSRQCRNNH